MINERSYKNTKRIYPNILQTLGSISFEADGILGYREHIICDYYFAETVKIMRNEGKKG